MTDFSIGYRVVSRSLRITVALLGLTILPAFGQQLDSLQNKFAQKVCDCLGDIRAYEQLKPRFNVCYDQVYNSIFQGASPAEVKFYAAPGNLKLVTQDVVQRLQTQCPPVRKLVEQHVTPIISANSCPTNFDADALLKAAKHPRKWNGRIVAFDARIVAVDSLGPGRPYLKVDLGDSQALWVGAMAQGSFLKPGNTLRFLGYFSLLQGSGPADSLNRTGFHVLSFGMINLKTKQFAAFPGSEAQIREWTNGKVPEGKQ